MYFPELRSGIYIGWIGAGNLGDEAMFQVCAEQLHGVRWTPLDALGGAPRSLAQRGVRWRHAVARRLHRELGVLGGGTVINRHGDWLRQYLRVKQRTGRAVPVLSPGVANPQFWRARGEWKDTLLQWKAAMADLPEIGVRGPISATLLSDAGFRSVRVTGDPVLSLYDPDSRPRLGSTPTVGINAGRSAGLMWGSEDELVRLLADVARALAAKGVKVKVFPVWTDDVATCREVVALAGLDACALEPLELDGRRAVQRALGWHAVVSVKLHAAVCAAAACVPFVAVEYRPKVRDFAASIGWEALAVRNDRASAAQVLEAVERLLVDGAQYRARLESAVAALAKTFREYTAAVRAFMLQAS